MRSLPSGKSRVGHGQKKEALIRGDFGALPGLSKRSAKREFD